MTINRSNVDIQKYWLELTNIFWKKFSVIMETIKQKTSSIIKLNLSNGIFKIKFTEAKLSKTLNWDFLLSWNLYYDKKVPIKYFIDSSLPEADLDNAVFKMTEKIQYYLLRKELEYVILLLQDKWMNVGVIKKINWPNLEFEIFNIENQGRYITIYLWEWNIQYDYFDPSMNNETKDLNLFFMDSNDDDRIYEWLTWTVIVLQNIHQSDNENE